MVGRGERVGLSATPWLRGVWAVDVWERDLRERRRTTRGILRGRPSRRFLLGQRLGASSWCCHDRPAIVLRRSGRTSHLPARHLPMASHDDAPRPLGWLACSVASSSPERSSHSGVHSTACALTRALRAAASAPTRCWVVLGCERGHGLDAGPGVALQGPQGGVPRLGHQERKRHPRLRQVSDR